MKKILLSLTLLVGIHSIIKAQQPMTIAPGLNVSSPTAGTSGLKFNNLNSSSTASTTPTKVLSVDASGNVILGNAASSGVSLWSVNATTNRIEANSGYPAGVEMGRLTSQISTSLTSPLINTIGGANTFLRFGRSSSTSAVFQESTTGFTRATSSIFWKYSDESNPQVITNLFGFTGSTNTFSVNGFTQLGEEATTTTSGVTRSSPSMKTILLTGSLTQGSSPETSASLTTTVPHGLNYSKIVDIKVLVNGVGFSANLVEPGFVDSRGTLTGWQFSTITDGNNVYIIRNNTNSANIKPGAGITATYRILITYIP